MGHRPAAVGLELMNEPVLLTGEHKLDAFHLKVGRALRAAAPGLCIYFEPNSLRNMTDAAPVATPLPLENTVYAPHLYTGVFQSNWKQGDVARVRASVQKMRQEAAANKAALMVGEFGNDPQTTPGRQWMTAALDQLDAAGASWALWLYEEWSQGSWGLYEAGPGHTRGALRQAFARQVARPFPTRLAGRLQKLAWDDKSRTLTVTFDGPLARPHVLSAPRLTYPDGVAVRCAGEAVTTSAPRPGRVAFECREGPVTMAPAR